jgi:hypothetical protein
MRAGVNVRRSFAKFFERIDGALTGVSAIQPFECWIFKRLHAEFERDVFALGNFFEKINYGVRQAVGASPNAKSVDARFRKRGFINFAQILDVRVSVRVALKVGEEVFGVEALADAGDALTDLLADLLTAALLSEVGTGAADVRPLATTTL